MRRRRYYREEEFREKSFLSTLTMFYKISRGTGHGIVAAIRESLSMMERIQTALDKVRQCPQFTPVVPDGPRRQRRPLSEFQIAEIKRLASEGRSVSTISHIMSIPYPRVASELKKLPRFLLTVPQERSQSETPTRGAQVDQKREIGKTDTVSNA